MKRLISGKPIPNWIREYDDSKLKDDARALNYIIDDKDKNLQYVGFHKIPQDDAQIDNYWGSSQNPALHKRQDQKNPNITFTIVNSGDVQECLQYERDILKKAEENLEKPTAELYSELSYACMILDMDAESDRYDELESRILKAAKGK